MTPPGHRGAAAVAARAAAAAILVGLVDTARPADGLLDTFDNAAHYYWKAAAKIRPPVSAEDFEVVRFIEQELPDLPPQVFGYRAEAGRRLVGERGLLGDLRYGAQLPACRFVAAAGADAPRDVSHRVVMRRVWRRALAAAKAMEFVGEDAAAAQVYLDLFKMLDHLDDDLDWATAYVCVQWQPEWLRAVEGFILRNPEESALQPLLDALTDMKHPRFPLRLFTEHEVETYSRWLFDDIDRIEPKLAALYGAQSSQPALQRLADLNRDERQVLIDAWAAEYRAEARKLEELLDQPYEQAIEPIRKLDARIAEIRRTPENLEQNHLLPLLLPPLERTFQQFVAAEGGYVMLSMLGAGAVFRGMVGVWPETRSILEQFSGRAFRRNPFTQEPFDYQIRKALPVIRMQAPRWLVEESGAVVEFDLAKRFAEDDAKLTAFARRFQEEQKSRQPEEK